jgi:hypothetical protein
MKTGFRLILVPFLDGFAYAEHKRVLHRSAATPAIKWLREGLRERQGWTVANVEKGHNMIANMPKQKLYKTDVTGYCDETS